MFVLLTDLFDNTRIAIGKALLTLIVAIALYFYISAKGKSSGSTTNKEQEEQQQDTTTKSHSANDDPNLEDISTLKMSAKDKTTIGMEEKEENTIGTVNECTEQIKNTSIEETARSDTEGDTNNEESTSVVVYDGKYHYTSNENYCMNCKKTDDLLQCSRCKCVFYCSRKCQRDNWKTHKPTCKLVSSGQEVVHEEAARLGAKVFQTEIGRFYKPSHFTKPYILTRYNFAEAHLFKVAVLVDTPDMWRKLLAEYQEIMRLQSPGDGMGVRLNVPFVMLYLNMDDEAYAFCRYWLNMMHLKPDPTTHMEQRYQLQVISKEGDWLFPEAEEGCRFKNIFVECPDPQLRMCALSLTFAVAIIKMRIIAAYTAKKKISSGSGRTADDESTTRMIDKQRSELNHLCDTIDDQNKTLLPAVINPKPLFSQKKGKSPGASIGGTPSEALKTLDYSRKLWSSIPGGIELLQERYGMNPKYDSKVSHEMDGLADILRKSGMNPNIQQLNPSSFNF